jgi:hypothetical protein
VIKSTVVENPDSLYPITLKPYRIFVSRAGEVEVDEATIQITNVSDQDLGITLVDQPPGYFAIDFPENVGAGQTVEGKLKVRPEMLEQTFEKSITIELSDNAHSRFTIPVIRRFIGAGKPAQSSPGSNPQQGGSKK